MRVNVFGIGTFLMFAIPMLAASLLLPTVADATIVSIDIDLTWNVTPYGTLHFSGVNLWENGVGYVGDPGPEQPLANHHWTITGFPPPCCGATSLLWVNQFPLSIDGQFKLDIEATEPWGIPRFIIPFGDAYIIPIVEPGDYSIAGALFVNSPTVYHADSGHIHVEAVPEPSTLALLALGIAAVALSAAADCMGIARGRQARQ